MLIPGIGAILIILSMGSIYIFFGANEWRDPLLELSGELKGNGFKKVLPASRRRELCVIIFDLILFGIGAVIIFRSPILKNYKTMIIITLSVLLFLFVKAAYGLVRAFYSKKTRLLSYLFSPYLFAWRRDSLSDFSDQEIAIAICKVCGIQDDSFIKEDMNLVDFLIALHAKTRPPMEHDAYPEILQGNIARGKQMVLRS